MKKHLTTILLTILLLAGLSLLLYPSFADYWNSFTQSRAISSYSDQMEQLDTAEHDRILREAQAYNETLWQKPNRFLMGEEEKEEYEALLDPAGTGMMGYVEIPSIDCKLPIYHGTDEAVLQVAVGHIEGSSLPVGGEGTHCILSGHRGLPSARLFTDIDQMKEGDIFLLRVLGDTYTYQVDQIRIVLPTETEDLQLERGKDYCTLVTCTPYGVNSHRLLVRGHRIENAIDWDISQDAKRVDKDLVALFASIAIFAVMFLASMLRRGRK